MSEKDIVQSKVDIILKKESIDHVLRLETDKFEICQPKEIRKRKWIFFQQIFIVHFLLNGRIRVRELK